MYSPDRTMLDSVVASKVMLGVTELLGYLICE
jgi:hypothetical protein